MSTKETMTLPVDKLPPNNGIGWTLVTGNSRFNRWERDMSEETERRVAEMMEDFGIGVRVETLMDCFLASPSLAEGSFGRVVAVDAQIVRQGGDDGEVWHIPACWRVEVRAFKHAPAGAVLIVRRDDAGQWAASFKGMLRRSATLRTAARLAWEAGSGVSVGSVRAAFGLNDGEG